jgi:hypothetical protein
LPPRPPTSPPPSPPFGEAAAAAARKSRVRDHGLRNLTLHTGAFNAGARAFYAALGFAEEEVRLTRPIGPEVEGER